MSHVPPALFTAMGVDQTMLLEISFLYEPGWHGNALLEFGYGTKGCYACYNEFCFNEMCDKEYMERLLGDNAELKELYARVYEWFNQDD